MTENRQKQRSIASRTSRPKPVAPGNEEAGAVLHLGEFQDVDTLTLSEASLVINALVAKRRADRRNVNETECVAAPPPFYAHLIRSPPCPLCASPAMGYERGEVWMECGGGERE